MRFDKERKVKKKIFSIGGWILFQMITKRGRIMVVKQDVKRKEKKLKKIKKNIIKLVCFLCHPCIHL